MTTGMGVQGMNGKICVITGANSGIGKDTAIGLAQKGAHIVMICRNPEKARAAQQEIREKGQGARVDLLIADLASKKQVRKVAAEFLSTYPRLDVLVNNAGLVQKQKQMTEDGIEVQWATNHLAPFLLTSLLLDVLKKSAPARVVTVSSGGHWAGHINFSDIDSSKRFNMWLAYCNSKLANILFARELAKRLEGTGVTSNALHPGGVNTNFAGGQVPERLFGIARRFMISSESGARTPVYLSSSPEVEGQTGGYYVRCKPAWSRPESRNPDVMRRLWEVSEKMTGLTA